MILGTHNSLSFIKAKQWYLRPFSVFYKCQNLSIQQQYNLGVRYFDIRIKYHKGRIVSGHGKAIFDIDVEDVLDMINSFKDKCYVRLYLEDTSQKKRFNFFCEKAKIQYKNIDIISIDGRRFSKEEKKTLPPHYCCHLDYGQGFQLETPISYSKKHNHSFHKNYQNKKEICIFDFVEIGLNK